MRPVSRADAAAYFHTQATLSLHWVEIDGSTADVRKAARINPCEEFLRHAADCEEMAKATGDAASRLT